ncbi:Spy/CpxP family protein refolding chaperone [Ferruginibacter sp. SUN106]|uniref:Spy/CpxP family protein refolding chaperone n=1 Tax=Ferruginibacter sp. SUN106 TaxID=2978348 RepID=UPI003D36379C
MNFFTNNRLLSVITLLLLTANIATLGYLWTHKNNAGGNIQPPPPTGQVFEFVTKELQLDSAQQLSYKKLREEHQAGQRPLQDSIRKAKDEFFELLKQPAPVEALVQQQSSKVAAAEQQLELFTFRHFQKLRAICTATQQKKFDDIIQDVLRRMAPAKRPQGPPPPGIRGGMPPPPGEGPGPGGEGMPPPPPENK